MTPHNPKTQDGPITTHVLDTATGMPAIGVPVTLRFKGQTLATGVTGPGGRLGGLLPDTPVEPGAYEIVFDTAAYAAATNTETFYPRITIAFTIRSPADHFHVPLLLSPFGYTTYRGSR